MELKATKRNVLVKMQLDNKEKYKLTKDIEITISKGFNFNKREDSCSLGIVVHGENIPSGSFALLHHNASHDTYKVFDAVEENLYSLPEDLVYCYSEDGKVWKALPDFLLTYRIFKPYKGFLVGIDAQQVLQRLYVRHGKVPNYEVEGKVVICTRHSDYEIIFHQDGRPASIIRTRLRELLGIDNVLTEAVERGEYLIGNELADAKPINKK